MAALSDYKVANKNLERKLKKEELLSTAILTEFPPVENEIWKVK